MNFSIILCALFALQEPAAPIPATQPAPTTAKTDWRDLDRVVMVVNEDAITMSEFLREMRTYGRERPITTEAQAKAAENEILTRSVKDKLAAQGGQDMGFDPKLVGLSVERRLEALIESKNGVVGMAKFLESQDLSTADARTYMTNKAYSELWHDSITGEGVGPGARPNRDRYVRPGLLRFHYDGAIQNSEGLTKLGGKPPLVTLQTLVIDASLVGTVDEARKLAEDLRRRVLEGEDMNPLVETFSIAKKDKGITEDVPERGLADVDVRLFRFVTGAQPGDVSPVDPVQNEAKTYFRFVKLLERQAPVVPPLTSFEVQKKLREIAEKEIDEQRLNAAYSEMLRASYVWPPEYAGRSGS